MKILHVIESLGRGGAEQALLYLLPELQRRGHSCAVLTLFSAPMHLKKDLEDRGVAVETAGLRHRWNFVAGTSRVARAISRGGFDVAHAHLFFSGLYTALSTSLAPESTRVVTFHNLAYDSYPPNTAWRKIRRELESRLLRARMDGYIAVSRAVAAHYHLHLGARPIEVIPNGFPLEDRPDLHPTVAAQVLKKFGIQKGRFSIVVPGRLVPEKGHRFLLQALARFRPDARPATIIVGDGPSRAAIEEEAARLGVSDAVVMHSAVPHSELLPLLQSVDLFVSASTHEGFGLAPAEAMLLGVPVLATRVGGLLDLIEDEVSGVLVPPADPVKLANAIHTLMNDVVLRGTLARAGRLRVERHFGIGAVADRVESYYTQIAAAGGSGNGQEE